LNLLGGALPENRPGPPLDLKDFGLRPCRHALRDFQLAILPSLEAARRRHRLERLPCLRLLVGVGDEFSHWDRAKPVNVLMAWSAERLQVLQRFRSDMLIGQVVAVVALPLAALA
jgi:hypothetical protein